MYSVVGNVKQFAEKRFIPDYTKVLFLFLRILFIEIISSSGLFHPQIAKQYSYTAFNKIKFIKAYQIYKIFCPPLSILKLKVKHIGTSEILEMNSKKYGYPYMKLSSKLKG